MTDKIRYMGCISYLCFFIFLVCVCLKKKKKVLCTPTLRVSTDDALSTIGTRNPAYKCDLGDHISTHE